MPVRIWCGCMPTKHAEGFARHLGVTGVLHAKRMADNIAAAVRQEQQGDDAPAWWQDSAAVRAFAGEDYQRAVT